MISTPVAIALGAVIMVGLALGLWSWLRRQPKPARGPILVEAGPTRIELAPYSETRGLYTFETLDLPPDFQKLVGIDGTTHVTQTGDSEADARSRLQTLLDEKYMAEHRLPSVSVIDAKPVRFKALNRRKGQ